MSNTNNTKTVAFYTNDKGEIVALDNTFGMTALGMTLGAGGAVAIMKYRETPEAPLEFNTETCVKVAGAALVFGGIGFGLSKAFAPKPAAVVAPKVETTTSLEAALTARLAAIEGKVDVLSTKVETLAVPAKPTTAKAATAAA